MASTDQTVTESAPGKTPEQRAGKQVTFELILPSPQRRARLPMRVYIFPHDTTESIISTTKNFYGLYNPTGVSFEDKDGNTLIAAYDNFYHLMTVYIRSIDNGAADEDMEDGSATHQNESESASKRARTNRNGDRIPNSGYSASPGSAHGSHSAASQPESFSRRRAPKFNSSELPLFVPSQVPLAASASSATSPNRNNVAGSSSSAGATTVTSAPPGSYVLPPHDLPSPRSGTSSNLSYHARSLPSRSSSGSNGVALATPDHSIGHGSAISDEDVALQLMRLGDMSGTIPPVRNLHLPDRDRSPCCPKVATDPHSDLESMLAHDDGYRSAGSYSSPEDTEVEHDSDGDGTSSAKQVQQNTTSRPILRPIAAKSSGHSFPPTPAHPLPPAPVSVRSYNLTNSVPITPSSVVAAKTGMKTPIPIQNLVSPASKHSSSTSTSSAATSTNSSSNSINKGPFPTPVSVPRPIAAAPGAPSIAGPAAAAGAAGAAAPGAPDDDEDLSTKPRCQRCRKSKKGCDRQRPCRRCRDAGISRDGCISEDEVNGRKGRYGRFMGVGVKKAAAEAAVAATVVPAGASPSADSRKRKR